MIAGRRLFLTLLAGSLALPGFADRVFAQAPAMNRVTAFAFSFAGLDGKEILLSAHAGKPILLVNTASLCGYTPQYAGLQALWTRYGGRGLMILGVPTNDFGGQEPGGPKEISATAHQQYHVGFPLAAKVDVKGPGAHPFYKWAALERPLDTPRWNFHKYLIGRDGHLKAGFTSAVEPSDARLIASIETELVRD